MTQLVPAALVGVLSIAPAVAAQSTPDFSGTWMMDASRSQSAVQDEPVKSMTIVIRQSPTDLRVEITRDGRAQVVTYKAASPGSLNAGAPSIWYWDGSKIVAEAIRNMNDTTLRHKATYALDADGAELTVESLVVVEHGYTLKGSQNYGAGKDVFKKVTP